MADPRDQQIDDEAIMTNLIDGGENKSRVMMMGVSTCGQITRRSCRDPPRRLMSNKLLSKPILARYIIHVY